MQNMLNCIGHRSRLARFFASGWIMNSIHSWLHITIIGIS